MSRRSLSLVVALVAAVLVATPGPVQAATTLFVDINDVDCDDNTVDSSIDPYCTIPAAVADAIAGDTIDIAAGTYTGTTDPMITIAVDLTLVGAGRDATIIDGESARLVINITAGSVSMSDLTVRNGLSGYVGANIAYTASGSTLTLTDVKISGGSADRAGGLGLGSGTTADLLRVDFVDNISTGTIGGGGGGAAISAGTGPVTLTVTDSTFTGNTAAAHGGAIRAYVSGGVEVIGSTFTDNESTGGLGGAISFHATGGVFTITDSSFISNDAAAGGGGVDLGLGNTTVSGSLFTENTSAAVGGGLYAHDSGLLIVANTTFHDNDALTSGGGAQASRGFFVNTTFSLNTSATGGGLSQASGSVHVANSILAGNSATGDGPDCYHITSEGHNLIADATDCFIAGDLVGNVTGQNPLLMPLADNGGPTLTMALAVGSPARHAGNLDPADPTDWDAADDAGDGDWSCAATDQRGEARSDVRCDIGAFEVGRVVRYAGANRYDTAATISEGDFTDPAPVSTVFIATGSNFPDGLAGAAAAAKTGGPLLLVDSGVPAETAAELTRLAPDEIVILGGTGAVSDPVKTVLEGYAPVTRVFGATRYLTAIAISQWAFPVDGTADVVFIATGINFPDALAAGAAAGALNGPVLLVPGNEADLTAEVATEILRLDPATIVVVGGTGAVSDGIFQDLEALQPSDTVTRISGVDRYATAAAISTYAFAADLDRFYVATGINFPDALAGSGAAGWWNGPVLLVPGSSIPAEVVTEVNRLTLPNSTVGIILGGTGVVGTTVEADLVSLLGP